ncbi:MAG: hypothetical protein R6U10_02640 [Thermoplasmatota archaeon]
METLALGIAFGAIISLTQFFSEHICSRCRHHTTTITSLSAGIAVSYLFLGLFPEFVSEVQHTERWLYVFTLLGFALLHLVEKYIYQHSAPRAVTTRLERENSAVSFIYHFIVGVVIVDLTAMGFADGLLFVVPIALYTALGTLPERISPERALHVTLSLAPLLGVVAAVALQDLITTSVSAALLGFVVGALTFTVIRHTIPFGRDGLPLWFIAGMVLYAPLVLLQS